MYFFCLILCRIEIELQFLVSSCENGLVKELRDIDVVNLNVDYFLLLLVQM